MSYKEEMQERYPMLTKHGECHEEIGAITEFVEYLDGRGYEIVSQSAYARPLFRLDDTLGYLFGIDQAALEQDRRKLLEDMGTGEIPQRNAYEAAVARFESLGAEKLATIAVKALATAGAIAEWDSETIEHVTNALETDRPKGVAAVDETEYWQEVAVSGGIYHREDL